MRWEYLVEDEDVTVQSFSRLNELGDQGWELVTVSKGLVFFKRPNASLDEIRLIYCKDARIQGPIVREETD